MLRTLCFHHTLTKKNLRKKKHTHSLVPKLNHIQKQCSLNDIDLWHHPPSCLSSPAPSPQKVLTIKHKNHITVTFFPSKLNTILKQILACNLFGNQNESYLSTPPSFHPLSSLLHARILPIQNEWGESSSNKAIKSKKNPCVFFMHQKHF